MIEVHNGIGVGFDEETHHLGLMRRFMNAGLPFVSSKIICHAEGIFLKQALGLTTKKIVPR
jgi:hypothetical protein